ncbi:uncharacterized protein [Hetaerina americana]|uniref:uncharacterized protein n=1 Tax=Hetaerina americana TaxID=62018 RepID=UPI003A7F2CCA
MIEKTTMRVSIAFMIIVLVACLVVSVVARYRHHSNGDAGGGNGSHLTAAERHSRSRGGRRGHKDPLEDAFIAHMDRVKDFRCRNPFPKALPVQSVRMNTDPDHILQPKITVLHRCEDSSGCCLNSFHSCQPIKLEEVTLVIQVYHIQEKRFR